MKKDEVEAGLSYFIKKNKDLFNFRENFLVFVALIFLYLSHFTQATFTQK